MRSVAIMRNISRLRISQASLFLVPLIGLAGLACSSGDGGTPQNTPGIVDSGIDSADAPALDGEAGGGDAEAGAEGGDADAGAEGGADGGEQDAGADVAPPEHLLEQVVGTAGGTVATAGGVTIEIPAGALPGDVTITIDEVSGAPAPDGATSLGKTMQLGPEGQTFATPVKVKLPWSGPDNVPVELAHAPKGGGSWTRLTDNAGFDATHVWAETTSFSWFQPVVYQGAADSPIVLDSVNPTSAKLVARGSTPTLMLRGAGFRGDTAVKLFKDSVTTATVGSVKLTPWGLEFQIPAAFTATLGLITIEAKNPAATASAAAAVHVIETPVLQSLSPSSIDITERDDNNYTGVNIPIHVTATDLPDDLSLCEAQISQCWVQTCALVATTTTPSKTASGFDVVAADWHHITGTSKLELSCSGVTSNALSITFNLIPKP